MTLPLRPAAGSAVVGLGEGMCCSNRYIPRPQSLDTMNGTVSSKLHVQQATVLHCGAAPAGTRDLQGGRVPAPCCFGQSIGQN